VAQLLHPLQLVPQLRVERCTVGLPYRYAKSLHEIACHLHNPVALDTVLKQVLYHVLLADEVVQRRSIPIPDPGVRTYQQLQRYGGLQPVLEHKHHDDRANAPLQRVQKPNHEQQCCAAGCGKNECYGPWRHGMLSAPMLAMPSEPEDVSQARWAPADGAAVRGTP
jgi:hypothetical protein